MFLSIGLWKQMRKNGMKSEMKTETTQQITAFDGLRGLGACAIAFFCHYEHFEPEKSPLKAVFPVAYTNGWLAVEMFCMLSGFVMMLGWYDRIREDRVSFSEYMGKRLYRIVISPFIIGKKLRFKLSGKGMDGVNFHFSQLFG